MSDNVLVVLFAGILASPVLFAIYLFHVRVMKYGRPWLNKAERCNNCGRVFENQALPVVGAVPGQRAD